MNLDREASQMRSVIQCSILIALLVLVHDVPGAQSSGQISVVSGSATDQRGVRSSAVTVAPAFSMSPDPRVAFTVFGSATQFADQVHSLGGGAAMGVRAPLFAAVSVTAGINGSVARTSFDATFANGEGAGGLELAVGPLSLLGGAQIAYGHTGMPQPVTGVPVPGAMHRVESTRRAFGPYAGVQVQLPGHVIARSLHLFARVSPLDVEGIRVRDDVVGIAAVTGPLTLHGSAGRRDAPGEQRSFAAAGASLALSRVLALEAAGGSYPSDRLTGAMGGRYFTAGLSVRFGGSPGAKTIKAPGAPAPRRGDTRLAIRARGAERVEVAGDWNDWQRTQARKAGDDVWYVDVSLAPGEYRYTFLIDGREWRVPEGAITADDGFGSKVAWVTVRDQRRR